MKQTNKNWAIASCILGLIGAVLALTIVLTPIGFVSSSLAIIFAGIQKKKEGTFTGLGTTGFILGIVFGTINLFIGLPLTLVWIMFAIA